MSKTRQYSDTLRALGRFLELVGASQVEINDTGERLEVSWCGRARIREERNYRVFELEALRTTARLFRGLEGGTPNFTVSELLRTLGRYFDEGGVEDVHIVETEQGYEFSGHVAGDQVSRLFTFEELVSKALDFHRMRGARS
jgi:hypothetical protein